MSRIRLIAELLIVSIIAFYLIKISSTLEQLKLVDQSVPKPNAVSSTSPNDVELQEDSIQLHSFKDVNQHISSLHTPVRAKDMALAIAEIDSWMIEPESEESVKNLIDQKLDELRFKIVSEVKEESQKALDAPKSKEAREILNNISLLISLYPMSEKQEVIEQAQKLTDDQRKLVLKLESLKRLRYNQWAVSRVEQALNSYHKNSSLWRPKQENKALIDSLVKHLGEVDPNLLEPIVLNLYNYAVDITKESISEDDRIKLAKALTEPAIQRLSYEEF